MHVPILVDESVPLCRDTSDLKREVLGLFAACTKEDVTLNNYITRSKFFGCVGCSWSLLGVCCIGLGLSI